MTLPGNVEKIRLLPILSTILKLSPAEIQTLQKTIQGEITMKKKTQFRKN